MATDATAMALFGVLWPFNGLDHNNFFALNTYNWWMLTV